MPKSVPGEPNSKDGSSTLDADTLPGTQARTRQVSDRTPTLTIAYHPDTRRIGEQARLTRSGPMWHIEISRSNPSFFDVTGTITGPLRHRFVSRQPLAIAVTRESVRLGPQLPITLDGCSVSGPIKAPIDRLDRGMAIELGSGVILVLKQQGPTVPARLDLLGLSDAIKSVRDEIESVGPQETSVLIQGETGVGKELIARALHRCSHRAECPFVAVNMGAIPKDTAVAELFGYKKGAFTGAVSDREGYFEMAEGGTLFLDEIGETPQAVQPILLRALANREVQSLGASKTKTVNVRVIAATDANLTSLEESGQFRSALLHRLSGYRLKVPPLRERKEDIAVLFIGFLREELARAGAGTLLSADREECWLPSHVVAQLLLHSWPGNVRELRNVASQLVSFSARLPCAEFPPVLMALGNRSNPESRRNSEEAEVLELGSEDAAATVPPTKGSQQLQRPSEISDERLLSVLRNNAWRITDTARELGISRNSLYELIDRCPKVRKARDISTTEIARVRADSGGNVKAMASELQISVRALMLRMKELRLK